MSKERITISPDLYDIMPSDYQDLVSKRHLWQGRPGMERYRHVQGTD